MESLLALAGLYQQKEAYLICIRTLGIRARVRVRGGTERGMDREVRRECGGANMFSQIFGGL